MSSARLFFLSPTLFFHSASPTFSTPSRAESGTSGRGEKLGIIRSKEDSGELKTRDRLVAKAGLGRYSGAIHGGKGRRVRRGRPPMRQEEFDEHATGDESSLEVPSPENQRPDAYENSDMSESVHDDGEPTSGLQESSYQRYLSELNLDRNDVDAGYQSHACKRVIESSIWVTIGNEGDLGYQRQETSSVESRAERSESGDSKTVEGGQGNRGNDGTEQEGSNKLEVGESAPGKKTYSNKQENERSNYSSSLDDEFAPVAATVVTNPELFGEPSSEEMDKKVERAISQKNGASDSLVESKNVAFTIDSSGKGRKQPRKKKKKSVSLVPELPTDDAVVRVVEGEAEQPATSHKLPLNQNISRAKSGNSSLLENDAYRLAAACTSVDREAIVLEDSNSQESEGSDVSKEAGGSFDSKIRNGVLTEQPVSTPTESVVEMVRESSLIISSSMNGHGASSGADSNNLILVNFASEEGPRLENERREIEDYALVDRNSADAKFGSTVQGGPGQSFNTNVAILTTMDTADSLDDKRDQLTPSTMTMQRGTAAAVPWVEAEDEQTVERTTLANAVLEQAVEVASKIIELPTQVASKVVDLPSQVASKVAELPVAVVEQATEVGSLVIDQMVEILPDAVTEQVVSQVVELRTQFSDQVNIVTDQVLQLGQMMVDQASEAGESVVEQVNITAEQVASSVNEQVAQVADSVTNTANQVVEQVTAQVADIFTNDEGIESDDEFEAYKTSDDPAFRGTQGLANFVILQEDQGVLAKIYDFYTFMLKQPLPEFAAAMFSAPILVSVFFTLLYLPDFQGLAFDETARDFFAAAGGDQTLLQLSWKMVFQLFVFSLSLSTGLQPELAPLSPYALIVANINALVAQLVFVFLSGAVFARLSQPAQPVRCSKVALISTSPAQRKRKENAIKVLMARYVLAGPQPCELVDVKVDLTYKYNTITRTGSYFRATQSLKLVRPEVAFLTHGMLVRHVIDSSSPLYQRTSQMLKKEDAVFVLSVVGLERSSMQSVFHVQHYCVCDDQVVWDAEFEDLILINSKKNKRIVDHSRLSMWRSISF